jgi:hypothetical protein
MSIVELALRRKPPTALGSNFSMPHLAIDPASHSGRIHIIMTVNDSLPNVADMLSPENADQSFSVVERREV